MRSNIVTEAGVSTRISQYWESIPFLTSAIVAVCATIYFVCLLVGYDSFTEVCFLPSGVVSHFQVYRIFTAILFHGSLLHVLFNMMALVPLGSELERIMGTVRLLHVVLILATTNALFHIFIAFVFAHNPIRPYEYLMNECAIGFSGVLFSMIVIETSLSGVQSRSVFGLFNVPAKWYAWILLIVFQLMMTNVSLLGHLCGILSGFAYTNGLFNYLLPGPSFYSTIESSSLLSPCVRRPKFILCSGGNQSGYIPTHTSPNSSPPSLINANMWRNISSWMPRRETTVAQATQDSRFPGRGRTLASSPNLLPPSDSDASLHQGLLNNNDPNHFLEPLVSNTGTQIPDTRRPSVDSTTDEKFDEELKKLVAMGFERTQVEVALTAAEGDPNVAVEILMTQQS
ncbi:Rhomboid-like protein 15 [Ranunculus cassubicifolius]